MHISCSFSVLNFTFTWSTHFIFWFAFWDTHFIFKSSHLYFQVHICFLNTHLIFETHIWSLKHTFVFFLKLTFHVPFLFFTLSRVCSNSEWNRATVFPSIGGNDTRHTRENKILWTYRKSRMWKLQITQRTQRRQESLAPRSWRHPTPVSMGDARGTLHGPYKSTLQSPKKIEASRFWLQESVHSSRSHKTLSRVYTGIAKTFIWWSVCLRKTSFILHQLLPIPHGLVGFVRFTPHALQNYRICSQLSPVQGPDHWYCTSKTTHNS